MTQRRHTYERAFEAFLRARRVPYVAVNEARKALLPDAPARLHAEAGPIKSFDFVLYGHASNLLVEVKGRRARGPARRLDSWVTREDVDAMLTWRSLFGPGFEAAFVFLYWCDQPPADGLFQEIFEHAGRWYAIRAIDAGDYAQAMRVRSVRWGTVHLAAADFERLSRPFAPDPSPADPTPAGHAPPGPALPALEPIGR